MGFSENMFAVRPTVAANPSQQRNPSHNPCARVVEFVYEASSAISYAVFCLKKKKNLIANDGTRDATQVLALAWFDYITGRGDSAGLACGEFARYPRRPSSLRQ